MASIQSVIQDLISKSTSSPPQILWNRQLCTQTEKVFAEDQSAEPLPNGLSWYSTVQLNNHNILSGTLKFKVLVAGQHIQDITDNGTSLDIVDVVANPNFSVLSATLDRVNGVIQVNWSSFRIDHRLISDYEFIKTDCDLGELGIVYHSGDTPFKPQDIYGWGVAVALTPRATRSIIKNKKFIIYQQRVPYFILEPADGSVEAAQVDNLFRTIELTLLDPFKCYLNGTSCPPSPPSGSTILS